MIKDVRFQLPDSIALTQIDRMVESPEGGLYVFGARDGRVFAFGSRGQYLSSIGRPGEGLGEFKYLDRLGWIGDSLWAMDPANGRSTLFSLDGRFRRVESFPSITPRRVTMPVWPEAVFSDGSLLARENWAIPDEAFASAAGLLLLRVSRNGRVLDTLRRLSARHVTLAVRLPRGGLLQRSQPWSDDDLYAVIPDGSGVMVAERPVAKSSARAYFRIISYGWDGRKMLERRFIYKPIALTQNTFDAEVDSNANLIRKRFPEMHDVRRAVGVQLFRPPFHPPVRNVLVGRDHSIWVNVSGDRAGEVWLVLDANGSAVATVLAPRVARLLAVSLSGAWGSKGTQAMSRYRCVIGSRDEYRAPVTLVCRREILQLIDMRRWPSEDEFRQAYLMHAMRILSIRDCWLVSCWILAGSFGLLSAQPSRNQGVVNAPALQLVREWTIGSVDGPAEYAFGQINQMVATRSGAFFLVDDSDSQLRRYDAAGRFRGLVGRSGGGPGEYRQIAGVALYGDSLLLVFDPANGRVSVFDTSGAYRRAIPFARGSIFVEKAFGVDRNGLIYVRALLATSPAHGSPTPTQYVRMRLDGRLVDSLPLPVGEGEGRPFVVMTSDGARWSFPSRVVYAVTPSGTLATAQTSIYRVTVPEVVGPPKILIRPTTAIALSGPEREEWEAIAKSIAMRLRQSQVSIIPRAKPSIRDISFDYSGRVWVNVYVVGVKQDISPRTAGDTRPQLTIREANVYDLFSPQGDYIGRVELPPQSRLLGIGADRIWVRSEGKAGEQILSLYRIPGLSSH